MSKFLNEFKEFAVKGNAVDMAVGVIIGGAFGKIVTSVVNDIIMPPIGWIIGGVKFTDLKFELPLVQLPGDGKARTRNGQLWKLPPDHLRLHHHRFLCLSVSQRHQPPFTKVTKTKETPAAPPTPPQPSAEERLLTEIRDLLKEKQ